MNCHVAILLLAASALATPPQLTPGQRYSHFYCSISVEKRLPIARAGSSGTSTGKQSAGMPITGLGAIALPVIWGSQGRSASIPATASMMYEQYSTPCG